ncbi:hypothetical protein [Fictibacillus macauensis]|uniref:hypothetical protein n=1 Tax=Fictibacillus macauensis TaxID=245160 RepID=UPI003B75B5D2
MEAREWAREFINWYNEIHLHSGLKFVTPVQFIRGNIWPYWKSKNTYMKLRKLTTRSVGRKRQGIGSQINA